MNVRVPDDVLVRSVGDDMVLLSLTSGHYFGLNPSGARMFELLADKGDTALVARQISEEFEVPPEDARRDVDQLCQQLISQALVVLVEDVNRSV